MITPRYVNILTGPREQTFLIDEDGYVITDKSSGNFCSQYTINDMKDQGNFKHRFFPFIRLPVRAYPVNTAVSPCSSQLGTIRQEERLRLSDRNSILMTKINVYIINPVVVGFQM